VNEKDRVGVWNAFKGNFVRLWRLAELGLLEIKPEVFIKVSVHYGGDESWLRLILGLKSAVQTFELI
jgi:hypothetical protein